MIGKTLGHYSMSALLGKGGMGEVYQAKDQKLGRDVAIKVLPEEFAKDAGRVARFQREAKLLASLNHPNIAAIHGLEEYDGIHFLVLELIEGDTLADRLKHRAIPVEEALKLALQMAEALEAAHEKGVIHRDLKPANIKVTPDGKVKVLDFGLAKAFAGEQAEVNLSHSPTLSEAATLQGVILGTAAYMSPEQARGKPVDKRTDIWAFGCVLYEMLTGKAAFQGEDVTEILAAVVKSGVNLDLLPANIHPRIREVIIRCLQKEQKKRYRDIGEAQYETEQVLADPRGLLIAPITAVESRTRLRTLLPWIMAVLGIVVAGVAVWYLKPTPPPGIKRVIRFTYELPKGQQLSDPQLFANPLAVSPDGGQFVYSTTEGLYLRSADALDAELIAGTDGYSIQPFFSPDGKWIGYFSQSDQKLKKVAIGGGAPIVLCNAGASTSPASWDSENRIVYDDWLNGIMRVSGDGGPPECLVKGSLKNLKDGLPAIPQMLPDGKTLLFTNIFELNNAASMQIVIQSLNSGKRKVLFKGGWGARYLPTGHIVYAAPAAKANGLFAAPFDVDKLETTGGIVSVFEGLGGTAFALSDSWTLVYIPQTAAGTTGTVASERTLVWVDREGKEEPLGAAPHDYDTLKISPDGTRVAFSFSTGGNEDIYVWDLSSRTSTRLTFDERLDTAPLWTLDGKRIIYSSSLGGISPIIYRKAADGAGEVETLGSTPDRITYPYSLSRDGKGFITDEYTVAPIQMDIGMMSMEGDHVTKRLLQEKYNECHPQISPDGRWLAYQSDESGKNEVYVRSFPDVNKEKYPISSGGGNTPLWSPDGRELCYRSGNATMVVDVVTEPAFKRGRSKILFEGTYYNAADDFTRWDIHPDGKKFLMIKPAAAGASTAEKQAAAPQPKIHIILNWFEELKDRVPVE